MNTIGERIRYRRKMLKMSQEDLAQEIGYTTSHKKSTISKIEKNINDLTRTKISLFAKALKTSEAYLMGWIDDPEMPIEEIITGGFNQLASDFTQFDYALYNETRGYSKSQQEAIIKAAKEIKNNPEK